MTSRRIAVVSAGISVPSSTRLLADRLAAATASTLRERGVDADVDVIELRDHGHELVDNVLTGFPGPSLAAALRLVTDADGLIAVTPTFSASYNGLFKLFFDVLEPESLAGKPALIAATGGTGRHSLALEHAVRPLFAYLRALVAPTSVFSAPEDWGAGGRTAQSLDQRIARAAGELADLVAVRPAQKAADPFLEPTPFEQLLNGS
ncbi:FMN reductase [Pseudonocardia xinjiangensis]|uniref:FMN reductase n=1 Tax=Pseudonocardia xinjiangensis TaxID=75289 RepID=A0ABX1RFH8_9PSEU|nr:FMN reductase [Pseudonocardia xinjiangensis]NMH79157.1 FMN reductase [Pseudonocardia xinjiangensis]